VKETAEPLRVALDRVEALRQSVTAAQASLKQLYSLILAAGFAVALSSMVLGIAIAAAEGTPLPREVVGLGDLGSQLSIPTPGALITLGVLVLVVTPAAALVGSAVWLARSGEWWAALLAGIALANVALGAVLGHV